MLTRFFSKKKTPDELDQLRKSAGLARRMFERAMREQGINSESATYWANQLDECEDKLSLRA